MGLKPAVRSPRHEYCRRGAAKCCPSRCQEGAMPRTMAMDLTIDAIDSTHRKHEFPPPPGFSEQHNIGHEQDPRAVAKKVDQTQLKIKKAKEQALQPARSFMMTSFMITFYAIYNPIKSAIGVNSAFARFADTKMDGEGRTSLILSKLVYVVLNLVAMLGALYKMSLMGLLPTTPSDWVSFLEVPPAAQFASGSEL